MFKILDDKMETQKTRDYKKEINKNCGNEHCSNWNWAEWFNITLATGGERISELEGRSRENIQIIQKKNSIKNRKIEGHSEKV